MMTDGARFLKVGKLLIINSFSYFGAKNSTQIHIANHFII